MRVNCLRATVALCLFLMFFTGSFRLNAQSFMQNPSGRNTTSLDGKWQIIIDWYGLRYDEIGRDAGPRGKHHFVESGFSDDLTLHVPGDWNSQLPELKYYEGTICYRRTFDYHKQDGHRVFLYFGAANYQTQVFLNGRKLGSHEGGFTPFQFEITGQVKPEHNDLVVIVDNRREADDIPGLDYGWWNYGGITRDVRIIQTPGTYIADYAIHLAKGSLDQVQGWVQLKGSRAPRQVQVRIPEAHWRKMLQTDSSGYAAFSFRQKLSLWSPAHPKLYEVDISTGADTVKDQIGFRSIEVKGTDILLNGVPIFLKGINMHEEIPQRMGRAWSEADAEQLLGQVKALGCNFVRLTHYPQNEHTIRLAQKMGILLWEEIPLWQKIEFDSPVILDKATHMLTEMISRDKNRCNIIIWSIANETAPGPDRDSVLVRLAKKAHELDPDRLVTSTLSHFKTQGNKIIIGDSLCRYLDVVGVNRYMGWYTPWPSGPGDVVWVNEYHKPVIFSEFGAPALYGNHGSADTASHWTEEFQEKVYKEDIAMFAKMPFLRGTCPWLLADYRDPSRMQPVFEQGWNRKGLLSDQGKRKKAWYVVKRYYEGKKAEMTDQGSTAGL